MRDYYKQSAIGFDSKVVRNGRAGLIGGEYQDKLNISIVDNIRGKIVLGTVCNVVARKGLNQIVKVLPNNKNYILMIVGDGPELVNLKEMARELNVESQLLMVGHQPNPAPFFKYFDVFMIPSHSEGMPLAMLEAASVGLPIVSSDIPTLLEMFTLHEVSFFKLNDIYSLEHSIHNALQKKEIFSENVKMKFDNCYSLERMSAAYLTVYQELVQ